MIMATRGEELLGETLRLAAYARGRLAEVDGLDVVDSDDPTKLALALPARARTGSRSRPTSSRRAFASSSRTATRSSRF